MIRRTPGALVVVTAVAFLSSAFLFAQSQAGQRIPTAAAGTNAAAMASVPRLADGKPDMQGYWTNQTFTPLERPAEVKDKEFFTAEEAAAWAKRGIDRLENQDDTVPHYDDAIWMLEGYAKGAML